MVWILTAVITLALLGFVFGGIWLLDRHPSAYLLIVALAITVAFGYVGYLIANAILAAVAR